MRILSTVLIMLVLTCVGCATAPVQEPSPSPYESSVRITASPERVRLKQPSSSSSQSGQASYYADRYQGRSTASGEPYDKNALTAAHRKLAFGTRVRVTNEANGKSVVVRINDRGPFVKGRIIDLSRAAFNAIGNTASGVLSVTVDVLD